MDFNQQPFIVIWETTQACDLVCAHCRAEAQPAPLPGELNHPEGLGLIDQVAQMQASILVLSGGDPLKRKGLPELIAHGKSRGLRICTIPAATDLLTWQAVAQLKEAGLDQMALSLDATTAERHDHFRGSRGAFQKTMEAVQWAHEVKLPLQINTVISQYNVHEINRLVQLVERLGIVFWEVFFLVPTGRGAELEPLSAQQCEEVFAALYRAAQNNPFIVKATEGPHFRRYYIQQKLRAAQINPQTLKFSPAELPHELRRLTGPHGTIGRAPQGVNAGKGHLFISHDGEIYPSGFLPLSAGNIRRAGLKQTYQSSGTFQMLRDADRLKGRCGICEYRWICGGSRARAFALSGDPLAEDPCCAYVPSPQEVVQQ